MKLILASASPRRKSLLEQVGLTFEVEPADINERVLSGETPAAMTERLSKEKAAVVAAKHPEAVVLAADTSVVFEGEIIGKPKDPADARQTIRRLSGKTHEAVTGYTVAGGGRSVTKSVTSKVRFAELDDDVIERYVATGEPFDKAGGYGIQDRGVLLVDSIEGDYANVVGLPLRDVVDDLRNFGIVAIQ